MSVRAAYMICIYTISRNNQQFAVRELLSPLQMTACMHISILFTRARSGGGGTTLHSVAPHHTRPEAGCCNPNLKLHHASRPTRWGQTGLRWWGAPAGVRWDRTTDPACTVRGCGVGVNCHRTRVRYSSVVKQACKTYDTDQQPRSAARALATRDTTRRPHM